MIIEKDIWIAEDGNGDINYFLNFPHKINDVGSDFIWIAEGRIMPDRIFSKEIHQLIPNSDIDLKNTPIKANIRLTRLP